MAAFPGHAVSGDQVPKESREECRVQTAPEYLPVGCATGEYIPEDAAHVTYPCGFFLFPNGHAQDAAPADTALRPSRSLAARALNP